MAVFKSIPSIRIIHGKEIKTSDNSIVTDSTYSTNGESCIVTKNPDETIIILNDETTDHVTIKSMCRTIIKTQKTIDDVFDEIELGKGASVELKYVIDGWYILSSDGIKEGDLNLD